jgi:hypothetical protein
MMGKNDFLTLLAIIFIDAPVYLWRRLKDRYKNIQEEDIKKMI